MAVFVIFYYFICNIFLFLSFREEIQYLSGVPRIIPNSLTEINNYTSTSYNAVTFSYKQHPFFLVSLSFHETHRWGGAPPYDEEQCLSSTRAMAPFCSRVCAALLLCHTRLRMSSGMSPRWRTSPVLRAGVSTAHLHARSARPSSLVYRNPDRPHRRPAAVPAAPPRHVRTFSGGYQLVVVSSDVWAWWNYWI